MNSHRQVWADVLPPNPRTCTEREAREHLAEQLLELAQAMRNVARLLGERAKVAA